MGSALSPGNWTAPGPFPGESRPGRGSPPGKRTQSGAILGPTGTNPRPSRDRRTRSPAVRERRTQSARGSRHPTASGKTNPDRERSAGSEPDRQPSRRRTRPVSPGKTNPIRPTRARPRPCPGRTDRRIRRSDRLSPWTAASVSAFSRIPTGFPGKAAPGLARSPRLADDGPVSGPTPREPRTHHEHRPESARRTAPDPGRLGRHVPGGRHVPDDGRGPGAGPGRPVVPGQPDLAGPGVPPVARRVGRVLGPRHDPAVVLVPGRRGPAVLDGEPGPTGRVDAPVDRSTPPGGPWS